MYDPDLVDDHLSHDESVGKYVMMNRVKDQGKCHFRVLTIQNNQTHEVCSKKGTLYEIEF